MKIADVLRQYEGNVNFFWQLELCLAQLSAEDALALADFKEKHRSDVSVKVVDELQHPSSNAQAIRDYQSYLPHPLARTNLALCYQRQQVDILPDLAYKLFEAAVQQNCAWAQYELGKAHAKGQKVPPQQAIQYYTQAAQQNFAPAQYRLGLLYIDGKGVEIDAAQGLDWLQKAAAHNFPPALNTLGNWYEHGHIQLAINIPQALHCYERAAALHDPEGLYNLAYLYGKNGTPIQDNRLAITTYCKILALPHATYDAKRVLMRFGAFYREGKLGLPRDPRCEALCDHLKQQIEEHKLAPSASLAEVFSQPSNPLAIHCYYALLCNDRLELQRLDKLFYEQEANSLLNVTPAALHTDWRYQWLQRIEAGPQLQMLKDQLAATLAMYCPVHDDLAQTVQLLETIHTPRHLSADLALQVGLFYYGLYINQFPKGPLSQNNAALNTLPIPDEADKLEITSDNTAHPIYDAQYLLKLTLDYWLAHSQNRNQRYLPDLIGAYYHYKNRTPPLLLTWPAQAKTPFNTDPPSSPLILNKRQIRFSKHN